MLLERVNCPFGCVNSIMSESVKRVSVGGSNLLLDSTKSQPALTEMIKVYNCSCCGRSFESHQPSTSNGRMIM